MPADLERLYLEWREAADRRSADGPLRPTAEEIARFGAYVDALENSSEAIRNAWDARRMTMTDPQICVCGHPLPHHDRGGRCFHVVGCATVCDCSAANELRPRR